MNPGLTRGIPVIWMLFSNFSSLFQEHVSTFEINVLLLHNTSITEQIVVVNMLESSDLAKSEELIVEKVILNNVDFLKEISVVMTTVCLFATGLKKEKVED